MKDQTHKGNRYLVLLADRKRASIFMLYNGAVERGEEFVNGYVPQRVKHGDDSWDAQDKILRHIEDHLHRHLSLIAKKATAFARKNQITGIIIGSHRPLFAKIEKHIPYPYSRKIKGRFVTELKSPFNEIVRRARILIDRIEKDV